MKNNFETLLQDLGGKETLPQEAHARMRVFLREYATMQPRREAIAQASVTTPWVRTFLSTVNSFGTRRIAGVALIAVVVFGATGSLAYAAEGTLPGDLLYPLKVDVTEPVRTVLAVTPTAQADWQITLATRRADEAATLASRGDLSTSTQTELATRFTQSIDAARLAIQKDSDAAANDHLAMADNTVPVMRLSAYVRVFDTIDQDHPTDQASGGFRNVIASAVQTLQPGGSIALAAKTAPTMMPAAFAVTSTVHTDLAPNVGQLRTAVSQALTQTDKHITQNERYLSASSTVAARKQLEEASDRADAGESFFTNGDTTGAQQAYRDSLGITAQLNVLIYAAAKLKVDTFTLPSQSATGTTTESLNTLHTPPDHGQIASSTRPTPPVIVVPPVVEKPVSQESETGSSSKETSPSIVPTPTSSTVTPSTELSATASGSTNNTSSGSSAGGVIPSISIPPILPSTGL